MTVQRLTLPVTVTIHRRGMLIAVVFAAAWFIAYAPLSESVLALGAVAALLLALVVPWLPWLGLAALLPFLAAMRLAAGTPVDLLLAGCLALWVASGVAKRSLVIASTLPIWAIFIFAVTQLAALLTAVDLGEGLIEVVKWGEFAAVLLVVPVALPKRHVGWLIAALLAAAAAQGLLGLYQFIYRIGPEWFLIQDRFMRASGTFRQPNPYAGYLGLTLPLAWCIALWTATRWWQARSLWRLMLALGAGLALAAIGTGLITSWSRGGWLGAVAGVALVMLLYSRMTRRLTLAAGVVASAGLLLGTVSPAWIPPGIRSRVAALPASFGLGFGDVLNQPVTDENFAVIERLAHWVAALRMWESNLWLGVGPGSYNAAYAAVALPRWPEPLGHAHNIYLNTLAESGVIGFAAFSLMWLALAVWVARRIQAPAAWSKTLAVGGLGMLAYLAVHSLFDNLFVQGIYLHIALWLACLAAVTRDQIIELRH